MERQEIKHFLLKGLVVSLILSFPIFTQAKNIDIGTTGDAINILGTNLCLDSSCISSWNDTGGAWLTNGSNVYYNSGNIGIGTSNPQGALDIISTEGFRTMGPVVFGGSLYVGSGNRLLTVDNTGNVFATTVTDAVGLPATSLAGQTLRSNGTGWLADSNLFNNGTNVGIGTTAPNTKLDVSGIISSGYSTGNGEIRSHQDSSFYISLRTLAAKSGVFRNNADFFIYYDTTNGNINMDATFSGASNIFRIGGVERMRLHNNGNLGIGVTTPTQKLHVVGGGQFSSLVYGASPGETDTFALATVEYVNAKAGGGGGTSLWGGTLDGNIWNGTAGAGNVGIGTIYPRAQLNIESAGTSTFIMGSTNATAGSIIGTLKFQSDAYEAAYNWAGIAAIRNTIYDDQNSLAFYTAPGGSVASTERMRIDNEGNVGIGTTAPEQKLSVLGDSYFIGNVGIGTIYPKAQLNIESTGTSTFTLGSTNSTAGSIIGTLKFQSDAYEAAYNWAGIAAIRNTVYDDQNSLAFYTAPGGSVASTERMRINNSGNVGIGTTTPSQKLHVVGGAQFTSTTYGITPGGTEPLALATVEYVEAVAGGGGGGTSLWGGTLDGNIWNGTAGAGNVGIGLTNPASVLDVNGLIKMRNATISAGEDVINKAYLDSALSSIEGGAASMKRIHLKKTTGEDMVQGEANEFSISWDVESHKDADTYSHDNAINNGVVTVLSDGIYRIMSNINYINTNSSQRNSANAYVKINGTMVGETQTATYDRGATYGEYSNTKVLTTLYLSANDTIEIGTYAINEDGVLSIAADRCEFIVEKIAGEAAIDTWRPLNTDYALQASDGSPTEALYVNNIGYVGIGTTNPNNELHVAGAINAKFISGGNEPNYLMNDKVVINSERFFFAFEGLNGEPSYSFDLDSDTGMFRPVANSLGFQTGGSERLRVNSTGNVGIGVTNPTAKLHVAGGGQFTSTAFGVTPGGTEPLALATVEYVDAVAGGGGGTSLWGGTLDGNIWNGTAGAGNVGIGTTAPSNKLQVENGSVWFRPNTTGTTGTALSLGSKNDGAQSYFDIVTEDDPGDLIDFILHRWVATYNFKRDSSTGGYANGLRINSNYSTGTYLTLYNNDSAGNIAKVNLNTNGASYLNGGNVGIGTNNPVYNLHVEGGASSNGVLSLTSEKGFGRDFSITNSGQDLSMLYTGGHFMINSPYGTQYKLAMGLILPNHNFNGKILIGDVSTVALNALDVKGGMAIGSNYAGINTAPSNGLIVEGNLAIGLTNPTQKLHVAGGGQFTSTAYGVTPGGTEPLALATVEYVDAVAGGGGGTSLWGGTLDGNIWNGTAGVGNVGVGLTNPAHKLDIAGSVNISDGSAYKYRGETILRFVAGTGDNFENTFLGYRAGGSAVEGQTAVGSSAGRNNIGSYQTAIGSGAGGYNEGYDQTAVGYSAGSSNTGGNQVVMGYTTGSNNSGESQTAIGNYAGSSNSGTGQTSIGMWSGIGNNQLGQTAIGMFAGHTNRGAYQTAVGYFAGYLNLGISQTAIGSNAGESNAGSRVIGVGYEATKDNTAHDVVAIGYQAGKTNAVANQFIVKQTNINTTPLIQGNFLSGNVGIGIINPTNKLHVAGGAKFDGVALGVTPGGTEPLALATVEYVDAVAGGGGGGTSLWGGILDGTIWNGTAGAGNVGIGLTNPAHKLDIAGSININGSSAYKYASYDAFRLATKGDTTDYTSTIIGRGAGDNLTNGTTKGQTVVGYEAGEANTALYQTAMGYQAGGNNIGQWQTATGFRAGYGNEGDYQIVLGQSAGLNNEGDFQTALGYSAGSGNTGESQTAIGFHAGIDNSGASQTVVGADSGFFNTGFAQTAVGMTAGMDNLGDYQIAIGLDSGSDNSGNRVIGIGYQATRLNSQNDVIAIGHQAGYNNTVANQFIVKQTNINTTPLIQGNFLSGNVGIGITAPTAKLHVVGGAQFTSTAFGVTPGGTEPLALATVEYVDGALSGEYLPLAGGTMSGDLNMGGNDILNINKLTVVTVDPLYRIKGVNYSSFAPSVVGGVKEEYVARVKIDRLVAGGEYEKVIDFSKQVEGSDLWVWRQTVDFSEDNVEVLMTPYGGFANMYYRIDGEKIILRANKPITVSYRLIGHRIDWEKWPTRATDQNETPGFIID